MGAVGPRTVGSSHCRTGVPPLREALRAPGDRPGGRSSAGRKDRFARGDALRPFPRIAETSTKLNLP